MLLCAPFIKRASIDRILEKCSGSAALTVYTRWFPEEIAAGVSETEVLETVDRCGGAMFLCSSLHAKYYRFDDIAFVGSANLTAAALGWAPTPNLEILVEVDVSTVEADFLEKQLRAESVPATRELAEIMEEAAALISTVDRPTGQRPVKPVEEMPVNIARFLPHLREPRSLYRAYSEGTSVLATASAAAAERDLAVLNVEPGLPPSAFRAIVASRLLQLPVVALVDEQLSSKQRFGAVRDSLAARLEIDQEEAERGWQTLMRWLLEFLPQRYSRTVPGHSELMELRTGS
jgi:hypothetical protein